jgi:hypothetical protein
MVYSGSGDEPMFQEITFYLIGGIPFIVYLGVVTFLMFFLTATIAFLKRRGKIKLAVHWHFRLAYISLVLGAFHLILGVSAYL